ncbi:hypothetical protein AVEN_85931-1 [Araneus ventricosus]|uniref:Uncharacterized protein n=1 Tax=Araneus ventricosus TaxID=182803 RepID=A0A4Y2GC98_ARAVE|nr:hypothetical protein AVEN_85931-1 [Araneus ventricosus]
MTCDSYEEGVKEFINNIYHLFFITATNASRSLNVVRSPKIPQIISGNFFSHAMDHRTEQVPQRGVLIKTPPKGAGFESGALGLQSIISSLRNRWRRKDKPRKR